MIAAFLMVLSAFNPLSAQAAADSVAVFHRPEKVVVLINERGPAGRLQAFMDAWGAGKSLYWESADKALYVNCGRNAQAATCTMRLLPGAETHIGEKESFTEVKWDSPGKAPEFGMEFVSSRGHRFIFLGKEGRIYWYAKRK